MAIRLRTMTAPLCYLLCLPTAILFVALDTRAEEKELSAPTAGIPEDPLEPFAPSNPITDEETKKLEARKLFVIGSGQLDNRQALAAKKSFEKALSFDPNHLAALKELVPLAIQMGEIDQGMAYCERALALDPNDAPLLHLLATRQSETAKLPEAVETLKRGLAIEGLLEKDPRLYLQIRSDLVTHLSSLGKMEEAIKPLEEIIAVTEDPERYKISEFARRQLERRRLMDYEQLARALGKLRRVDEAIAVIEKARGKDENGKRLALVEAELYFELGNFEKAARALEIYIPLALQNRGSLELYEKTLDKLGQRKDLIGQLGRWLQQDAQNPVLREFYVEKLIDVGDYTQAQNELGRLRGRASAVNLFARLYRKMNEPAKLLETLTTAIRTEQQLPMVEEQLEAIAKETELVKRLAEESAKLPKAEERQVANHLVALIAHRGKENALAIELLRKCLEEKELPSNPQIYFELVEWLFNERRFEEVVTYADEAVKSHPAQRLVFLEYQARALESIGKGDEALAKIDAFIKDVKETDDVIQGRLLLVRIYMQREDFDQAIAQCRAVLSEFPNQARTLFAKYMLATVLSQKGEMEEYEKISLELLGQADQLSPEFAATLNNDLGYTWADHGRNLDQAEVLIRKALDLKPNEPAYLDSLGWVLFKKGKYSEAAEHLRRAAESPQGQDSVIYDHLGDVTLKLEDRAAARQAWEKAIELLAETKTKKAEEQRTNIQKKLELLAGEESAQEK